MSESTGFITEEDLQIMRNKAHRILKEYKKDYYREDQEDDEEESSDWDRLNDPEEFEKFKQNHVGITKMAFETRNELEAFLEYWENVSYTPDDLVKQYSIITGVQQISYRQISRYIGVLNRVYRKIKYPTREERHKQHEEYKRVQRKVDPTGVQTPRVNTGSGRGTSRQPQEDRGAFEGRIYTDRTRLSDSVIKKWKSKSIPQYLLGGSRYYKHFIIGYMITYGNLFYEIWYNNKKAAFEVIDRNGYSISKNLYTLDDAVTYLINMISDRATDKDITDRSKRRLSKTIQNASSQSLNYAERRDQKTKESVEDEYFSLNEGWIDDLVEKIDVEVEALLEGEDQDQKRLLEQNQNIRQLIKTTVQEEMFDEYWNSELNKNEVKRLLVGIASGYLSEKEKRDLNWREKVKVVAKRGFRSFFGLELMNIKVNFVVGFKIKDVVKVEVWEVVRKKGNRQPEFYVVDISSKKVLRRNFKTFRQAINEIRKRFVITVNTTTNRRKQRV